MKKVFIAMICAVTFVSCGQNNAEKQRLQAENDSLRLENAKNSTEMDEMLSLLNEIENDFQLIREAENYVSIQNQDPELTSSRRDQIRQNMLLISETLRKNKQQLKELEDKLDKSNVQSAALRQTIARLTKEIDDKAAMIVSLQEDLARKNVRIQELDDKISEMTDELENLSITTLSQSETLRAQDKDLNTAYYCFGASKELKDQQIISGGGVFSKSKVLQDGFNRDYFISVDIRELKEIPLFAKKAKVLSNHPQNSYELLPDEDKNLSLVIRDYAQFWSLGKYLVIEVSL